ncbi:MAG: hydrolase [Woeseiaceae bacterium]|nr:hydrolase [Woeseiaceae bacterium]
MTEDSPPKRIFSSRFEPAWWLRNRHAQTIFPALPFSGTPRVQLESQLLDLPDGDVTMVDWMVDGANTESGAPLLVILHGLEGSAQSSYAQSLMYAAARRGWRAAVLHFRDCGDYRNRLPRRYHAGETNDIRYFLERLRTAGHDGPMFAAGFSLGGSVLLKYLGENGVTTPLQAAAAVSVPLDLHDSADALTAGFSKIYQHHLLKRMKRALRRKFDRHTAAFEWKRTMRARTFADFDDAVTAPLHGFSGKDEYYDRCSSAQFLKAIRRPTLIINALDDPFMTPAAIPEEDRLSEDVTIEVSKCGGHVGFVSGGLPWRPEYYLPARMIGFFAERLETSVPDGRPLPGM